MSSLPRAYPSSGKFETWREIWRETEKKSGNYAAVLTFGLVLSLNVFLLLPSFSTGATVPKGDAPLVVEIRRMPPPPPVEVQQKPDDMRKLMSETPAPESLVLPEPVKPEPKKETPAPVKPEKKPVVKQKPQMPVPVKTAEQSAEPVGDPGPAAPIGHASGETAQPAPDKKGEILAALLHAVEANKKYPRNARRAGIEGRVTIKVTINASGKVSACIIAKESGKTMLDSATLQLGESLIGLDIPAARGRAMSVLIPVQYALKK